MEKSLSLIWALVIVELFPPEEDRGLPLLSHTCLLPLHWNRVSPVHTPDHYLPIFTKLLTQATNNFDIDLTLMLKQAREPGKLGH